MNKKTLRVNIYSPKLIKIIHETAFEALKKLDLVEKSDIKKMTQKVIEEMEKIGKNFAYLGKKIDKFGEKNDKIYKEILLTQKIMIDRINELEERIEKIESIYWKN